MSDFEMKMRDILRSSEQEVDDSTARALAAARKQALSKASKYHLPRFLMPTAGMALASLLALVLVYSPDIYHDDSRQTPDELLLSENADLYEEMDFYNWLASADNRDLKG